MESENAENEMERNESNLDDDNSYICDNCGEEIVVPIDLTAGSRQEYVEDCPVCCSPNLLMIDVDPDGSTVVTSRSEQDRY